MDTNLTMTAGENLTGNESSPTRPVKRGIIYAMLIVLLAVYNFFFWGEKLGVNLTIFLTLTAAAVMTLNEENIKSKTVIVSLLAFLYAGAMAVVVNSEFSIFAAITVFAMFAGFVHQRQLRTVYSAFFTAISGIIIFPYHIIEELRLSSGKYKPVRIAFRITKLAFIPLIFFTIFYSIYAYSNPVFNSYSVSFWDTIGNYLYDVFKDYPVLRFFYIFLGLIIVMAVLFNRNIKAFADMDKVRLDTLARDKYYKTYSKLNPVRKLSFLFQVFHYKFKMNSLKLEYRMGLTFIIMINLLLLTLNIIDLQFTWLGFNTSQVDNLAYYVHNGTYLLIFSILLSMAILLYFFRSNQNFYKQNNLLKYGAYLWIAQNVFMALSVGLRNLYYIDFYYALSYKRIGVMIYLLLVFIGLITMVIKIHKKKTLFYLLKVNSAAAVVVLLLISSFSWDKTIAEFNLSNPSKGAIDIEYLFRLNDDALPVLDKHQQTLNREYMEYSFFMDEYRNGLDEYKWKVKHYMDEQNNYSWLSWNLPDHNIKEYYSAIGLPYNEAFMRDFNPTQNDNLKIEEVPNLPKPDINAVPKISHETKNDEIIPKENVVELRGTR